jgi:hypothetical protein
MQPLRVRIDRIVDFGTVVSLVGVDTGTALPVTVHVDHRPFAAFWQAWCEAGLAPPIEYDADRLTLRLDMMPTDDADQVHLVQLDGPRAVITSGDQQAAQEIDR